MWGSKKNETSERATTHTKDESFFVKYTSLRPPFTISSTVGHTEPSSYAKGKKLKEGPAPEKRTKQDIFDASIECFTQLTIDNVRFSATFIKDSNDFGWVARQEVPDLRRARGQGRGRL